MAKEHPSNIGVVCDAHAPKPQEKFQKMKPEEFIGKYVKKAFLLPKAKGLPSHEHMWVRITTVVDGRMVGELNNDPVYVDLKCGDQVEVELKEIEDLYT